jgi:hypothetical protein
MPSARNPSVTRKHATRLLVPLFVAGCGNSAAPAQPEEERALVERVIGTLASDDMQGRFAYDEGGRRAAAFLAAEFEAAGLEPLEGLDGYLQTFVTRAFTVEDLRVAVDGEEVEGDRVFARLRSPSIAWASGEGDVVVIGPEMSLQDEFRSASRRGDVLILVAEAHARGFDSLRTRFAGRTARALGDESGTSMVVALADATDGVDFEVHANATVTEVPISNVIGVVPGRRSEETVVFSGHYDHIGIQAPVDGDSIGNGANDNASGTTAVVALARRFARRGTPERSLIFVAFTAEEGGGFGARYFSNGVDPAEIVAMFNIEMIGKPGVEGPNTAWITGFERSSFGTILQDAVAGTGFAFGPDPYPEENLFFRSDNATLARLGVPAHSISTTPIDVDPDYHQVTDHVETLDLDHMVETIRGIARAAETIVDGLATPTRVDPDAVVDPRNR